MEGRTYRLVGVPGHLVRLKHQHVDQRGLSVVKMTGKDDVSHHLWVVHHVEHEPVCPQKENQVQSARPLCCREERV